MITLAFLLDHQVISRSDKNTVVAGSKNYVRARFILRTDDWTRPITAIFGGYTQLLDDNNECTVPWEVLQQPGKVEVSAFCGDLHTANIAVVPVEKTGYKSGETPKDPTPDVYTQLTQMVQDAVDTANSVREDADAGEFDGERGPKGDTGLGVPSPTQADTGKVPTVKADGSAYELAGPYAPLSAAIRPTASGNPVNITDSVEWPLQGLKVYGKSTQDGTPSPENPVPIVSAGGGGSIALTISDGAGQSQSLTISTPNGLPGIPVASGGTVTIGGQQYAANIRDYGAGLDTIAVGRIVLDGTEEWIIQSGKFGAFLMEIALPNTNMYNKNGLCSHFDYATENNRYNGIYVYSVENVGAIVLGPSLTNQYGSNVETWKTFLQTQSSQGHPVEVLYRLAEPYTQAIPAEELAAYRALHTYDGATVVSTAEDVAGLEVKYLADGEKYVDRIVSQKAPEAAAAHTMALLADGIREGVNGV